MKAGTERSSTDRLLEKVLEALGESDFDGEIPRVANHNVKPGVKSDEGRGDAWPAIRRKILASGVFILETPIPSSIAKRVVERLDAQFDDKDDHGRMKTYNKIAL